MPDPRRYLPDPPSFAPLRRVGQNRLFQSLSLAAVLILMLGASPDPANRFSRLGHQMICPCGCTQVLLECNHVGCPDSDRMIGELRAQLGSGSGGAQGGLGGGGTGGDSGGAGGTLITSGGTDTSILNWFAAKYGPTVLAAPIRGGFDNVAWIAPLAVFFLATVGTAVVVRVWKLRSSSAPALPPLPGTPETAALRDRIRRETEY